MFRYAVAAALVAAGLPGLPACAATATDKMTTCKFGADDQKLTGAARGKFIKKCMSGKDEPRGAPAAPQ